MHEPVITRYNDPREILSASIWAMGAPNPTEHRIRNLSMCGACLDHDGELHPGMPTRVTIGRIDVPAMVAWVREGLAGIRFDQPIDLRAARKIDRRATA